jgi:hypothetical protein
MKFLIATAMVVIFTTSAWAQEQDNAPTQRATETKEGIEVLTRGPVHEAFAETITFDPEPGLIVPKAPPESIEELPPNERPEGDNVSWIPGYWAWDDERDDFLWVSGIWRALPPGRQWVPGYWAESGEGAQWISGYWSDAEAAEQEYLPPPPASVEVGPSIAAPSRDHYWVPGCWMWRQTRYAWRPGYWSVGHVGWIWIPAHYVWTPRGYVFIDGYHDYGVDRRGICYAPVYFDSRLYAQRRYSYAPTVAISPAVFINHLFLRPQYGHYYFGDYYGGNYASRGFSPWFSFYSNQRGYDPFFAYQSWANRQNRDWQRRLEANYQNYRDNENARPPRTWDDQRKRMASASPKNQQEFLIAAPVAELAKKTEQSLRFQKINENERQQIATREQAVKQFRAERQKLESQVIAARPDPTSKQPREIPGAKARLPKSPIVAQPMEKIAKEKAPPKRDEAPPPDMKVEPKPKSPRTPGENQITPRKPGDLNPKLPKNVEPKPQKPKADPPKSDIAPKQPPKPQTPKADPPRNPAPKNDPPKMKPPTSTPKQPPPKSEPPKTPAPKVDPPKAKPPSLSPPKQQPPRQPPPKQEPPKGQAPKSEPKEKPKGEGEKPK